MFVAIDIMGPLSKAKIVSRFIGVMTDRHAKLTRAIPAMKTTVIDVAFVFVENWLYLIASPTGY